ncbi:MAG: hypothetical protein RI924_249 [Bacteroidota bacterium]|jgi:hypothetical protein
MNPILQLSDPSFQTQHSGKCDLLVEILPDALQFAVIDKGQDQLKILYRIEDFSAATEKFSELTSLAPALNHHYRKVKIAVKSQKFTLIPEDLFDKTLLGEYAKFITQDEQDRVFYNHIRAAKCMVVFTLPGNLVELLNTQFHEPQFFHAAITNIEAGMKWAKAQEDTLVLLHLDHQALSCTCFKEGKLVFFNIFPARTADEFNYFLLNVMRTLDLASREVSWLLAGVWDADYQQRVEKYSQKISQVGEPQFIRIDPPFEQLEMESFFSLTALSICE